jgi:hypothetical protein
VAANLTTYTTQTQRLLRDLTFNFWPQTELTDYINEARTRVAIDSKCLRQVLTGIPLVAGTEQYNPQTYLATYYPTIAPYIVDVMGITLYYGNLRYKLGQLAFTRFDARFRRYQLNTQRPVCFSRMSPVSLWFGPNPDQAYTTDWDVAVSPVPLALATDPEVIPIPFQTPVKYYAAHMAKYSIQALGEADLFEKQYLKTLRWQYRAYKTHVIADPYSIGV